jgi:hypothetical protein
MAVDFTPPGVKCVLAKASNGTPDGVRPLMRLDAINIELLTEFAPFYAY